MTPQSARIYHISPDEEVQIDLKYADGGYRVTDLNFEKYDSSLLFTDLSLPEPQVINLDESSDSSRLINCGSGKRRSVNKRLESYSF